MTRALDGGEADTSRLLRAIPGAAAEAIRSIESMVAAPGMGMYLVEDYEAIHIRADDALLTFLDAIGHPEVADAYRRLRERIKFYYA